MFTTLGQNFLHVKGEQCTSYASLILICTLSLAVEGEASLFQSVAVESKGIGKHLYFAFAKWEDLSFPLLKANLLPPLIKGNRGGFVNMMCNT